MGILISQLDPQTRKLVEAAAGLKPQRKKKWNSGRRADLNGQYFRSGAEANIARYLNFLKAHGQVADWEYEPKRFDFPIKRGTNSYLPDFKVWLTKCSYVWWEVKGWRYRKGETALKRMALYYPGETIVVIDQKQYRDIAARMKGLIPYWE